MRYIFLLAFLLSFLDAKQTQIVIGTYSTEINAQRAEKNLQNYIQEDQKFSTFLETNSIHTLTQPLGKYYIVSLAPIQDIVTQTALYAQLQKSFNDIYVRELSQREVEKETNTSQPSHTFKAEVNEEIFLDDPLLAEEPDIASLPIQSVTTEIIDANKSSLKKKEAIVLPKQHITKKNETKKEELNVLEEYMYEGIALIAILLVSVIYFMVKRSKHTEQIELEALDVLHPSTTATQTTEEDIFDDASDTSNEDETFQEEELQEPMIMQERVEQIQFDGLEGAIEGSFGELEEQQKPQEEVIEESTKRKIKKRDVPPHGKISKSHFKEFAGSRILVAEDNLINQKVISGLLAETGIEIVIADDGKEALDILKKDSDFAFILMDAHMPRIDGFEATRQIRANPAYDHILVVALSGDTAADDIKKMQEAGMQEHLEKPLRMDALYDIFYAYSFDDAEGNSDEFVEVVMTNELNGDEGLSICGGDVGFYHEILNEFVESYSNAGELIQTYLQSQEMQKADKLLLDIIGVTANIGASILHGVAKDLKDALADTEEKSYLTLADEFDKHLHYLLRDIKAYK